jgi:hypothetical protein
MLDKHLYSFKAVEYGMRALLSLGNAVTRVVSAALAGAYFVWTESLSVIITVVTEFYALALYNPWIYFYAYSKSFNHYGLNPSSLSHHEIDKPAILFLHGVQHNQSGALPLAKVLTKANVGAVFTVNLIYDNGCPEIHEQQLRKRIEEIQQLYALKGRKELRLILIGHSRGGIEALNYACCQEPQENVFIESIITIASRVADVDSLWRACPSLMKSLMKKIMAAAHRRKEILYHIVSSRDWIVPLEATLFNTEENHHHILHNRSHMGILYAEETHIKVVEFIRQIAGCRYGVPASDPEFLATLSRNG